MITKKKYEFYDNEDLHDQIIAMDNTLAKKSTKFTVEEQRLFYIVLASIRPDQKGNEVVLSKKAVIDMLGFQSEAVYSRLRPMFVKLMRNSLICFGDNEIWCDGFLFSKIKTTKRNIIITIDDDYIPLLIELAPGFTRLLSDDAISFKSKFSMLIYQQLMRLNTQGDYGIGFTTKELKTLFGLTKNDYVYNGNFNRALFEKKTIDVAVKDINEKSKCISNLRYEKRKKGNRIQGYVFLFDYTDPNVYHQTYSSKDIPDPDKSQEKNEEFESLLKDLKEGIL